MKVYELLADRANWTQGQMARDINGTPISMLSEYACKFCLWGAIDKCYGVNNTISSKVRNYLKIFHGYGSIAFFNDTSTHKEVLSLAKELDI